MHLTRRQLVAALVIGLAGAASAGPRTGRIDCAEGMEKEPAAFPPFELQASSAALRQLCRDLIGWRVERVGGRTSALWLKSADGTVWLVDVAQRDVAPLFEVFTLGMVTTTELKELRERWTPPPLPADVPENFRQLLTARPSDPVLPTEFEPWPFRSWRTEVVRRTEFIVPAGGTDPTFGDNPNVQSGARPGSVPTAATAFCEVAAGVLFTGDDSRLLLAVDCLPMNLVVLEDSAGIDAYIADCELVGMAEYLRNFPTPR